MEMVTKYKRLTNKDIHQIMKSRALGYNNQDIAKILKCSEPTISYHLTQINNRAKNGEADDLFWGMVAIEAEMGIVELLTRLKKDKYDNK
jgi:FixJ family two-component response regulator